jgi:hypothetical protein
MKYKLKDINPSLLKYTSIPSNERLFNIEYLGTPLEFQTPKVVLEEIVKEDNKQYLLLKLIGTEACKTFYTKVVALEENHRTSKGVESVKSIFKGDCFLVKVPFRGDSVGVKVHDREKLCNYYHLKKGNELICLLSVGQIWISDNNISYVPHVKEILVC